MISALACAHFSRTARLCLFLQLMLKCCRQVGKTGSSSTLDFPLDCWIHKLNFLFIFEVPFYLLSCQSSVKHEDVCSHKCLSLLPAGVVSWWQCTCSVAFGIFFAQLQWLSLGFKLVVLRHYQSGAQTAQGQTILRIISIKPGRV